MVLDWDAVKNIAIGFLGGTGLMAFIFKQAISEWLSRIHINWADKRDLSKKVLSYVAEGARSGYTHFPTSRDEMFDVAMHLEGYDKDFGKRLRGYVNYWCMYATKNDDPISGATPKEQVEFYAKMIRTLNDDADFLRERANKYIK